MDKIQEWNQQRLEELILNNAEENVHLDFKAGSVLTFPFNEEKRKDICKDVSAFANSDGGILIYGINEYEHKAHAFSFIDGNAFTKKRLEQIINDGIQRRIDGIVITPVRFDNDLKKTIYVVEVPISYSAPHLSKDKRYYKRFNFQSVIMEEYEVRHTYTRRENAKLEIEGPSVEIENYDFCEQDGEYRFKISIGIRNFGHSVVEHYKLACTIKVPMACEMKHNPLSGYAVKNEGEWRTITGTNSTPIYGDEVVDVLEFTCSVPMEFVDDVIQNIKLDYVLYTSVERQEFNYDIAKTIRLLIGLRNGTIVLRPVSK